MIELAVLTFLVGIVLILASAYVDLEPVEEGPIKL